MDAVGPIAIYHCIVLPWRVKKILALREDLGGHSDQLLKQVASLKSAIGVASYAVQLESLESALDSSTVIKHRDMRQLWKKKIGGDRTKVKMTEFCEAFFSTVYDNKDFGFKLLREKYIVPIFNRNKKVIKEKIGRSTNSAEVGLSRFLSDIFNSNNDDDLSVYELCREIEETLKCTPSSSALKATTAWILAKEFKFMSKLVFTQIKMEVPGARTRKSVASPQEPSTASTAPDAATPSLAPDATLVPVIVEHSVPFEIKPFRRALIHAEVPIFTTDFFEVRFCFQYALASHLTRRSHHLPIVPLCFVTPV